MKMKKGVYILAIFLILSIFTINLAIAQEEQEEQELSEIDKAYACLEEQLAENCGGTKSTKQTAFNLLAIAYDSSLQSDCKSSLSEKKKDNCWGETDTSPCNIKSTALAILALNHIDEDVEDSKNWLLSKRKSDTGLIWYLEIDSINETKCTINGKEVTIRENKKITGSPPSGLKSAYSNYWFEITDINKNFSISCDKDFITALVYQKPESSVYHILSETQTASEHDTVTEKVNSYCFSTSGTCDYEGTLWTSLALAKLGEDISPYIPYLSAMSDKSENRKYLPSAFLYILTEDSEDYHNELISLQKKNNYWDESRDRLYDTALALLALQNTFSDEAENAKTYLLSAQKTSGCWQSNTAFILHSAWPKHPSISGGGTSVSYCEDFGHYCTSVGACPEESKLSNFDCYSLSEICCEVMEEEPTCSEQQGVVCELDEECSGIKVPASDTYDCCQGDCLKSEDEPECERLDFSCKTSCDKNEEERKDYSPSCYIGEICCAEKQSSGFNWWLIILLIILIILVVLAIIFRNQLKVFIFKTKHGFKSKKHKPPTRPGPSGPGAVFPMPKRIMHPFQRPPPRRPGRPPARPSTKDKEFEDTMKKLRDMSK